eukprot:TRINITY_DN541_c0_g3_i1.p1 TRINITY_DN541_c0_g3~~TRINITY_DN541_c0_g3_i1.p1  ORF type:complete len:327 (-),score=62.53 TRINITY_DN541_c0_g3_i1:402-1382(-)
MDLFFRTEAGVYYPFEVHGTPTLTALKGSLIFHHFNPTSTQMYFEDSLMTDEIAQQLASDDVIHLKTDHAREVYHYICTLPHSEDFIGEFVPRTYDTDEELTVKQKLMIIQDRLRNYLHLTTETNTYGAGFEHREAAENMAREIIAKMEHIDFTKEDYIEGCDLCDTTSEDCYVEHLALYDLTHNDESSPNKRVEMTIVLETDAFIEPERVQCPCGGTVMKSGYNKHIISKAHIRKMKELRGEYVEPTVKVDKNDIVRCTCRKEIKRTGLSAHKKSKRHREILEALGGVDVPNSELEVVYSASLDTQQSESSSQKTEESSAHSDEE